MPVRKSTRQQSGHDDKADAGSLLAGNAELVFQSAKVPFQRGQLCIALLTIRSEARRDDDELGPRSPARCYHLS
jgi:hypothetical protein